MCVCRCLCALCRCLCAYGVQVFFVSVGESFMKHDVYAHHVSEESSWTNNYICHVSEYSKPLLIRLQRDSAYDYQSTHKNATLKTTASVTLKTTPNATLKPQM